MNSERDVPVDSDLLASDHEIPGLLRPGEPNAEITLAVDQPAVFSIAGASVAARARVVLRMLPQPRVVISSLLPGTEGHTLEPMPLLVKIPHLRLSATLEVEQRTLNFGDDPILSVTASVSTPESPPAGAEVTAVEFGVLNLGELTRRKKSERSDKLLNSHHWRADGWEIELATDLKVEQFRQLQHTRGHGITYRGRIRRSDESPFTWSAAKPVLESLEHFLSFVRGDWCGLALPCAVGPDGGHAWTSWDIGHASGGSLVPTWVPRFQAQILENVFPGFFARWSNGEWERVLRRLIYWYVGSNKGGAGIEGSTILSMTGLELVTWSLFSTDRGALSADSFRRLAAKELLRLALSEAGVPFDIPQELPKLLQAASAENWDDGPEAITELRHGYVHPGGASKADRTSATAKYEAWQLAQWYLELLLLYISGYAGRYANRLNSRNDAFNFEPVPWAPLQD